MDEVKVVDIVEREERNKSINPKDTVYVNKDLCILIVKDWHRVLKRVVVLDEVVVYENVT